MSGVPGALRRSARQPLRVASVALLGATVIAAAGVQGAAAMTLQATVDEDWRGVYDILVTPPDGVLPIDGLLPPNALATTKTGMTLDDVKVIRSLDDVDVAAPIGEIVVPGLKTGFVRVSVPVGITNDASAPIAYRASVVYTTDDGLGERVMWSTTAPIVIDETLTDAPDPVHRDPQCADGAEPDPDLTWQFDHISYRVADYPGLLRYNCSWGAEADSLSVIRDEGQYTATSDDEAYYLADLGGMPLGSTRITLVDPTAERALLGDAGAFLDPLVPTAEITDVKGMSTWARETDSTFARSFLDGSALQLYEYPDYVLADLRRLWAANGEDWDEWVSSLIVDAPAIPMLIAEDPAASLRVRIEFEAFGSASHDRSQGFLSYVLPEELVGGLPGEPLGSAVMDASEILNPFGVEAMVLPWPGTQTSDESDLLTSTALAFTWGVGKGMPPVGDSLTLEPFGFRMPVDDQMGAWSFSQVGSGVGAESAYVGIQKLTDFINIVPPRAVPVGSFTTTTLNTDEFDASYVPLGAYTNLSARVASGPYSGATMQPPVSGLGLTAGSTVAIAPITSARLWNSDAPVSAVRVRVADVTGYDAAGQAKVLGVAEDIEQLGFTATIVAGSSPTDRDIEVDGYAFGTLDPKGTQTVGPLGAVTQRWSELGAASRVTTAVSTTTLSVLGLALIAGLAMFCAAQVAQVPARRAQAGVMRENGFPRTAIARWFAAEEAPTALGVVVLASIAVAMAGFRTPAVVGAAAAVGVVALVSTIAVIAASRFRPLARIRDAASSRAGARSIAGFGARQVLIHPGTALAQCAAIAVVGVTAAALISTVIAAQQTAGLSSLALVTVARLVWPQVVLAVVGVIGAALLAQLVRRVDLSRRAEQFTSMRAMGWTARDVAHAQRVEATVIVVPAVLVAAGLTATGVHHLALDHPVLLVAIAALAALATGVAAALIGRRGGNS